MYNAYKVLAGVAYSPIDVAEAFSKRFGETLPPCRSLSLVVLEEGARTSLKGRQLTSSVKKISSARI